MFRSQGHRGLRSHIRLIWMGRGRVFDLSLDGLSMSLVDSELEEHGGGFGKLKVLGMLFNLDSERQRLTAVLTVEGCSDSCDLD